MKISILDDYHDTLRTLRCFSTLAGHDVTVWTDHVQDVDTLAGRLRDAEALVLIRERTRIEAPLLERLHNLRLINQRSVSPHVDAEASTRHSVSLSSDLQTGSPSHAAAAADVADVLQIPAFLCRQTDLLVAAAKTGRIVNIKKGQFLAPDDVKPAIAKVVDAGNSRVLITERGTSFGYHNLVVDMRAFPIMRADGVPVVFDVTHSLQLPGAGNGVTAGQAEFIVPLASAGVAAGVDGVFLEVHDDPSRAKSDAQNALRLDALEPLLVRLTAIDAIAKQAEARLHG